MKATKTIIGMAAALALGAGTTAFGQVGGASPEEISPPVPQDRTGNTRDRNTPADPAQRDANRQNQGAQNTDSTDPTTGNRGTTGQPGNHSGMNPADGGAAQPGQPGDTNMNNTRTAGAAAMGGDQSVRQQLQQIQASPEQATQKLFILEQGMMNQWEIQFSDAVASKSQDEQVKQLAQMTKQDHQKAQDQLRQVAQKHNVSLPDQLPAAKQQKLAILSQLPPEKLDKCFLAMQKSGHAAAITSLSDHQQMFKEGDNQELSSYIDQTLPTVKQHANRIVEVAQSKGMTGDLTTIASSGANNAEMGTSANRDNDNSAAAGSNPMPPKARDGALRGQPGGDQVTGEQRE
jgi:putative membrane protein